MSGEEAAIERDPAGGVRDGGEEAAAAAANDTGGAADVPSSTAQQQVGAADAAEPGGEPAAEEGLRPGSSGAYSDTQAGPAAAAGSDAPPGAAATAGGGGDSADGEKARTLEVPGLAWPIPGGAGAPSALSQQHERRSLPPGSDAGVTDSTPRSVTDGSAAAATSAGAGAAPSPPSSAGGSRPLSAFRDLRGSRPNSAAIASMIEGFDADFLEVHPLHDVPEGGSDDGSDAGGDTGRSGGPGPEELLARARLEQRRLLKDNAALQRRARGVLDGRAKGRAAVAKDLAYLEGAEARYRGALKQWSELREERRRVEAHYSSTVFDMKVKLEGRIRRAEEIAAAFGEFKRQVALSSKFSRSGRPLGDATLQQLEEKERVAEEAVQRARLKNVHLANSLKKLEGLIRSREQLAEGLHLIDFEQLKIENQSLSEKIEERNEELLKLRRKNTNMVQVLTHMKEKLSFVSKQNAAARDELASLESQLAGKRDEITALKARRDGMRAAGARMRGACQYVTSPLLLADLAAQRERRDDLVAELEDLKRQHAAAEASAAARAGSRASSMRSAAGPPGALRAAGSPKRRGRASGAGSAGASPLASQRGQRGA